MKLKFTFTLLFFGCLLVSQKTDAQLQVSGAADAQSLVQRLVGEGITISNISFTGNLGMTGFFKNIGGTNINIDSGIVLTNGLAKSRLGTVGVDGNGSATASNTLADKEWHLPGDIDLANEIGSPLSDLNDACVLEFDFVPLGDSIKFKYVFSSEEYTPPYVCSFNDAFAFFISQPGVPGSQKNIALVPGTTIPVSIFNVNDVPGGGCPNNTSYFVDNTSNTFFTHDGHTTVLTALSKVQPCQNYHLKLVISDVGDDEFDSGVFLEAKSLSSNVVKIGNVTQTDAGNNPYLVEGCITGSITLKRPQPEASPLPIVLTYAGTAINGVDVQTLPPTATIPANQTSVTIPVIPIVDNIPEGIETLKIYAFAGCSSGTIANDSLTIQIRDYDTLGITPDTAFICNHGAIQLKATTGYSTYVWDANPTLSSTVIRNPVATPVNGETTYYCTATLGTCNARDSSYIATKILSLVSKKEINCKNGSDGEIQVTGGPLWTRPAEFSINSSAYQADSTFTSLPVGTYTVRMRDAAGCIDSIIVNITQLYPDLVITKAVLTDATCTGGADGTAAITAVGGKRPYTYSADGINFQADSTLYLNPGNYTITVMDNNNCTVTKNITVLLNNSIIIDAGPDTTICEGLSAQLHATSNAASFVWSPTATLDNNIITNPVATPVITTKYYIVATLGICNRTDSMTVFVNPAPIANAGPDQEICFGQDAKLNGSGGIIFLWTPASLLDDHRKQNPTVQQPTGSISYALNVVDGNGCQSLQKDYVYITVTRKAVVDIGRDDSVSINQPLQLNAIDVNGSGFTDFVWTPSYGLSSSIIKNPLAVLDHDVTYTVTASTPNGCIATDTKIVKVYKGPDIYVPTAFTPNGDGVNDILRAVPIGMSSFHFFTVYNRWGVQVFTTRNADIGWDGKTSGNAQETAAYSWIAEGVDYRGRVIQRKGSVVIVR